MNCRRSTGCSSQVADAREEGLEEEEDEGGGIGGGTGGGGGVLAARRGRRKRTSAGSGSDTRSRDECITRRFYCAFVIVMLLIAAIVIIACLCSATADADSRLPKDCPKGTWPCQDQRVCINSTLLCNEVPDCPDGSDEASICDPYQTEYIEDVLVKRPDADWHRGDPVCTLGTVPVNCTCTNKTNLFCKDGFTAVPQRLPRNMTYFDLSGNILPVIQADAFGFMPDLSKLLIIHSEVHTIEDGALAGCLSLTEVHMTTNMLTRVPGPAFAADNKLKKLSLVSNRITILTATELAFFPELEILDLAQNNISHIAPGAFSKMVNLRELDLTSNRLVAIFDWYFRDLHNLRKLFISSNDIRKIDPGSFISLDNLRTLGLNGNRLRNLQNNTFTGLNNLTVLQLENNGLRTIDPDAFAPLVNVRSVTVEGSNLYNMTNRTFSHMKQLYFIYFDKFYQCVYAQHAVECYPRGDGISSRENLLENIVLRVCVWVVAILACVGNIMVFLGRFLLREDNQIHSFFIKNLSLADMLMGVYLLVIGAQDIRFRGEYLLHDESWRNSMECDISGIISTLSTEMSVLTLCVITLDRYISIMYPLSFRKRGLKAAYAAMICTWGVCIMLALFPVLGFEYFGSSFYRDNGVCIPLHLHEPRARGWEYSSFLFLGINLASFGFIAYAYTAMFWSIRKSAIPLRTSRESRERCLVKRFFFIVITDFLCWIPIIIIKVIALGGVSISGALYAWVIVFILPVNSALNPLLYTLTTKLFKQKLLSKFTSVVWRPTTVKDGSTSSRASLRVNSSLNRKALQDVELEMLRRHGCYKDRDKRDRDRDRDTATTPIGSSGSPGSHFWNGGSSPARHGLERNGRAGGDYTPI